VSDAFREITKALGTWSANANQEFIEKYRSENATDIQLLMYNYIKKRKDVNEEEVTYDKVLARFKEPLPDNFFANPQKEAKFDAEVQKYIDNAQDNSVRWLSKQ